MRALPMRRPVVQAPMAGGPSTPALAAAVSRAGGLGTLAGGYLSAERLAGDIAALRELLPSGEPFGVNLFAPSAGPGDPAAVAAFAALLEPRAAAAGVELGEPRFDDDHYAAKLELLAEHAPAVVSLAFGLPREGDLARLQAAGAAVWITVTSRAEAELAVAAGADAVIAQGGEAGGHRGSFTDHDEPPPSLAELLAQLAGLRVPVIAAGGIMGRPAGAAALAAGAAALQCGTAFLRCPEAGTAAVHRAAVGGSGATVLTRAFSGRRARGIANAWSEQLTAHAPAAYPELHHLTAPLRAHGRASGDPDLVNLWAGTRHAQATQQPAAGVVDLLDPSHEGRRAASLAQDRAACERSGGGCHQNPVRSAGTCPQNEDLMTATQPESQGQSSPALAPPPPPIKLRPRQIARFLRGFQSPDVLRALASFPGDAGLIQMQALRPGFLFVRDPEHARQVLVTKQDNYLKGSDYKVLAILLGQGLLTNEDPESWQRNRKLVQPLFAKRHLSPMAIHMTAATSDWLDDLERRTRDGEVLDVSAEMMALTLDVVCRALFGAATDRRQTALVGKAMEVLLHAAQANIRVAGIYDVVTENPRIGLEFEDLLPLRRKTWNAAQRGKAQLDEIVHGLIDARAAELGAGAEQTADLLSLLLQARDERGQLGRGQVRDEVMTFLGAGHETTANALTWLWMVLSQHPDARRRMQDEVEEVLGGRTPTYEDAERLPWTSACFHEAMRLFPPVPAFSRVSVGDDEIDGVRVTKGTGVAIAPYLLHRNPRLWDNPEGFDPERFMPDAPKPAHKLAYMPFGGGRRVCVGQGFAVLEGVLLAAMISQRVRFDLVPGTRVRNDVAITLRPRDGMPMTVHSHAR